MNLVDIHKSIANTIKTEFKIPCYARDTEEGGKKPCFFLELNIDSISRDNKHYDDYSVQIELTYVDTKRDEELFYSIIEKMKNLYKHYIHVNDRWLHVNSFDYNYVGDNDEQLAFQIETQFKDINIQSEQDELIQDLNLEIQEGR